MTNVMIYGATGYTGTLVAEHAAAVAASASPQTTLAGRDAVRTEALITRLDMSWTAFDLADPAALGTVT